MDRRLRVLYAEFYCHLLGLYLVRLPLGVLKRMEKKEKF